MWKKIFIVLLFSVFIITSEPRSLNYDEASKRMQSETDCSDQNGFIILPPMPSGLSFKKILAPLELVFSRISK